MNDDQDQDRGRAGGGELESALTDSLERRAGRVVPARLAIADVRAAAARTRRARTARLVGGTVAAVAAVAVVAALLPRPAGDPDRPPSAPTGAPSTPTATPTATPTPTVSRALGDLPRGAAPGVGVLAGDTLTDPGGGTRTIPAAAYDRRYGVLGVTRAGDDLLVADPLAFEGTNPLSLVADGVATRLEPCTSGTGAGAPDGRSTWVTFSCPESNVLVGPTTLVVRDADGAETSVELTYPPGENVLSSTVGLLGDLVVVNRAFRAGALLVDPAGVLTSVPGVARIDTVSPDGRTAVAELESGGPPNAVVDVVTGQVRWRAPDLVAFSPAGDRVLAGRRTVLTVRDAATGRPTAALGPPDGVRVVGVPVWEDDRHVLAVAADDVGRSVVRLGLDGSVERAGPALPDRGQVLLVP